MFDARWGDDPRDADPRDADQSRGREHDNTRSLGRGGGGSDRQSGDQPSRDARDHARWPDRDREAPERLRDPHVFARHVDLPRGPERERVRDRDRDRTYRLRGSESRTLATVGAFRVVSSGDLRNHDGSRSNLRSGDLRHLPSRG
mgnify:CR=1 FL=1